MQTFQNRMLHEIVVQVSNTIHGPFVPFQLLQVFESLFVYVFRALNAAKRERTFLRYFTPHVLISLHR